MYVRYKLGHASELLPEETLLHAYTSFRAITLTCAHSYGIYHSLFSTKLSITDRRLLLTFSCLPFSRQEVDFWFPGRQPAGETGSITGLFLKEGFFGRCLEIESKDPSRRHSFFSSPNLIMRIFCKETEQIEKDIRAAMI
jgi:hypothetical protein